MGITYGDHLIDSGYYDITPEQEREREEQCSVCGGDCAGANPPPYNCPNRRDALREYEPQMNPIDDAEFGGSI
jgi:hypothetical protein